jgi:hypothetical protein
VVIPHWKTDKIVAHSGQLITNSGVIVGRKESRQEKAASVEAASAKEKVAKTASIRMKKRHLAKNLLKPAAKPPTPPPTQSAEPTPAVTSKSGPVELTLVASRGNSYIHIVVDGSQAEKGSMFQGESKTFKGKNVISIYLSNPAGLDLTLNGKQLAPLGGQNEEVRRTFR